MTAYIEMDEAANILKLLGNEVRLTMLKILENHDCCVCEFVEIFQASQPSISQHLRRLKDAGLIEEERKGQWTYYSRNDQSPYADFVTKLLNQLPDQTEKLKELEEKGTRIQC